MKNDNILLEKIGLNDNEITIYKLLLSYDSLSISQLLNLTKIKRGNLYSTLYLLIEKNLSEEFEKNKKKFFRITDPTNLKKLALNQKYQIEQTISGLDNIILDFRHQFELSSKKPLVWYYEGLENIKYIYEQILKEKTNLDIFTSLYERQNQKFVEVLSEQIKKQKKIGIKVRSISGKYYTKDEYEQICKNNASSRTIKNMKMESEIYMFGSYVGIITFKHNDFFITLIRNDNIAQTMKIIFNSLWSLGESPDDYIDKDLQEVRIKYEGKKSQ